MRSRTFVEGWSVILSGNFSGSVYGSSHVSWTSGSKYFGVFLDTPAGVTQKEVHVHSPFSTFALICIGRRIQPPLSLADREGDLFAYTRFNRSPHCVELRVHFGLIWEKHV